MEMTLHGIVGWYTHSSIHHFDPDLFYWEFSDRVIGRSSAFQLGKYSQPLYPIEGGCLDEFKLVLGKAKR